MKLPLNEREHQVMRSLAESGEGEVLIGFCKRLCAHVTNTRNIKGGNVEAKLEAANMASDIIEENLIGPLSRTQRHNGEHERFD